jgi:hypothetical protein
MKSFGIKKVWYSTDMGTLVSEKIGDIIPYIKKK